MHGPKYPPAFVRAPPVSSKRAPTERKGAVPSLILSTRFQSDAWQHLRSVLIVCRTLTYVHLPPECSVLQHFRTVFVSFQHVRLKLKPTWLFASPFLAALNVLYEFQYVQVTYGCDWCLLFSESVSCFWITWTLVYSCGTGGKVKPDIITPVK